MIKSFYLLSAAVGFFLAVLLQIATIGNPTDAYVAETLARAPDRWEIYLEDSEWANRFSQMVDLKAEVIRAFEKRTERRNEVYFYSFLSGLALMGFGVLGLVRERKLTRMEEVLDSGSHARGKKRNIEPGEGGNSE